MIFSKKDENVKLPILLMLALDIPKAKPREVVMCATTKLFSAYFNILLVGALSVARSGFGFYWRPSFYLKL
jgi:hypothetical protein